MDNSRFIETTFLSEDQLIDKHIKIRSLNSLSEQLKILEKDLKIEELLAQAYIIRTLIEDAYNVSMYKFQFKIFTLSLNQEIKTLSNNISASK
jgi:hypothetical protein